MNETVNSMWAEFARAVMPKDASNIQRSEMKKSFYAGAWRMLQAVKEIGEESVNDDEGVDWLEACYIEIQQFRQEET